MPLATARESRTWNTFVGLNVATAILFGLHLVEEWGRGALAATEAVFIIGPVLLILVVGTAYAYLRHMSGLGMALGADIWLVIAVGYSHFYPGSPDFIGNIFADWGGGTGVLMATLAVLVWVAAAAATVEGAFAVLRIEQTPVKKTIRA